MRERPEAGRRGTATRAREGARRRPDERNGPRKERAPSFLGSRFGRVREDEFERASRARETTEMKCPPNAAARITERTSDFRLVRCVSIFHGSLYASPSREGRARALRASPRGTAPRADTSHSVLLLRPLLRVSPLLRPLPFFNSPFFNPSPASRSTLLSRLPFTLAPSRYARGSLARSSPLSNNTTLGTWLCAPTRSRRMPRRSATEGNRPTSTTAKRTSSRVSSSSAAASAAAAFSAYVRLRSAAWAPFGDLWDQSARKRTTHRTLASSRVHSFFVTSASNRAGVSRSPRRRLDGGVGEVDVKDRERDGGPRDARAGLVREVREDEHGALAVREGVREPRVEVLAAHELRAEDRERGGAHLLLPRAQGTERVRRERGGGEARAPPCVRDERAQVHDVVRGEKPRRGERGPPTRGSRHRGRGARASRGGGVARGGEG